MPRNPTRSGGTAALRIPDVSAVAQSILIEAMLAPLARSPIPDPVTCPGCGDVIVPVQRYGPHATVVWTLPVHGPDGVCAACDWMAA